jgi:DNA-binding MarR family transcriptional regulator
MSKSVPEPLDLRAFLPYRLSVLTNRLSRKLAALYSERFGLTIAEWRAMAVLGQTPGLSADGVGRGTEMDKVSVSRAVGRLLDKGYLERSYAEDDKRRSVLTLSPEGYAVYAQIVPLARDFEAQLKTYLTDAERLQLLSLLGKLDAALK